MKIIEKIAAWKQAAEVDNSIYTELQKESVEAVIGGIKSAGWEKCIRRFHSNEKQLQRLLGNDNLDPRYKNTILAYIGSDGTCGGGTKLRLSLGMPDIYKAALDSPSIPEDTRDDGSNPMPLPSEIDVFIKNQRDKA